MGKSLSQRTAKENLLFRETKKNDIYFVLEQTKLLKGTVVNQALSSLHGGSLEIIPYSPFKGSN